MGFFKPLKSLFGWGSKRPMTAAAPPKAKTPFNRRNAGQTATFTPVGPATFEPVGGATFELDVPPLPQPRTFEEDEASAQQMLEREGYASAEAAFLAGEPKYVISSNVQYFQYLFVYPDGTPENELIVGFKDGSAYLYEDVSLEEALTFYHAGSPGGAIWDNLRLRGTVFGFQKNYRLIEGNRVWHAAGADSIARHEAIPKSGEPWKGFHPATQYRGAKGAMGAKAGGIDLSKRGGSKKVAYFTPVKSKAGFGPRP